MNNKEWPLKSHRFVALMDVLGFKDLVNTKDHDFIFKKLSLIKNTIDELSDFEKHFPQINVAGVDENQSRSFAFSDSIICFSRGDTFADAFKIIFDSYTIVRKALKDGIPIKGAISFGEISVDFNNSLFFGKPIIDAHLLHDELQMMTVILDNAAEVKIKSYDEPEMINAVLVPYKANLRSGKINHTLLRPYQGKVTENQLTHLLELYKTTYGKPRTYIDNTLDFLNSLTAGPDVNYR